MLFNSIEFFIFSIIFFSLWPIFRIKNNSRWFFITTASFIFYGWWDWRFLFLIIGSGLIDFYSGRLITKKPKNKKLYLIISLLGNLGALSVFKYSIFFATVIQDFFGFFNFEFDMIQIIPEFALILPVGISFYTFQSLSYTLDVYNNRLKPINSLLHFFSYLSMFPQLVAGPIVRAKDFLKQLESYKIPNSLQKWNAIKLICFGLFQKMVIADNLGYLVDSAFEGKTDFDGVLFWWIVMIAFSFQIYSDFSGYSLIARGLAKYMGYHFKMNFNHPYLSASMKGFWSNWHISLSTWFRDYVYIPLGGSKGSRYKLVFTLTITMILSGLWHGASYTFVMWALIHTTWLVLERLTNWNRIIVNFKFLSIVLVFIQVLIAWVYFRSKNITQGNEIVMKLFTLENTNFQFVKIFFNELLFLVLAILIESIIYFRRSKNQLNLIYKKYNIDVFVIVFSIICILFLRGNGKQFIYFQF